MELFIIFLILGLLALGVFFFSKRQSPSGIFDNDAEQNKFIRWSKIAFIFFFSFAVLFPSIVIVPTGSTGHLIKKLGTKTLAIGKIIAINGEMGRQGRILQEGFKIAPFIKVFNKIEIKKDIIIPEGKVGTLVALDGASLGSGVYIAEDWVSPEKESERAIIEKEMLAPKNFLTCGGKQGPQVNVLKPGAHKINQYLWTVEIYDATRIEPGFVGVVKSNVGKVPPKMQLSSTNDTLAQSVVPMGFMGIWETPLTTGNYYLNPKAYEVTPVDIRIQTWEYVGGYVDATIDLTINDSAGTIEQTRSSEKIPIIEGSADIAIESLSKDAWKIFTDCRMQVQVQPADAPYIVASVGGIAQLENKIITPNIRSVIRNIAEKREATEFVIYRSAIEDEIETIMQKESSKSRLQVKEFRLAKVSIPPELLVPDKRKQLAIKLNSTYQQEKIAFEEKTKAEEARQQSAMQYILVKAQIEREASMETMKKREFDGKGEKLYMMEKALGQKALRDIFGTDAALTLELTDRMKTMPKDAFQVPLVWAPAYGEKSQGTTSPFSAINMNQWMQVAAALKQEVKARIVPDSTSIKEEAKLEELEEK